jgi:hypothetical protein
MYGCRCLGVVAPAPTLLCLFADWLLHIVMSSYYPSTSHIWRLLFLANLLCVPSGGFDVLQYGQPMAERAYCGQYTYRQNHTPYSNRIHIAL